MGEPHSATAASAIDHAIAWLIDGARDVRLPQDVMAGLGARLLAAGLPLHRVALFGARSTPT